MIHSVDLHWEVTFWGLATTMSQFIQQIQTLVWPVLQRVWLYKPLKHLTTSWHLSWPTSCMPPSATILLLALTLQPETSSVAGIQDFLGGIFTERHALVQHQRTGAPGQRISQDLTGPNFSHCMSVFKILTLSLAALLRILSLELSLVQLPLVLLLSNSKDWFLEIATSSSMDRMLVLGLPKHRWMPWEMWRCLTSFAWIPISTLFRERHSGQLLLMEILLFHVQMQLELMSGCSCEMIQTNWDSEIMEIDVFSFSFLFGAFIIKNLLI